MNTDSFKNSNFDEVFGSLLLVRHPQKSQFYIGLLLFLGLILLIPGIGVLTEGEYLGGSVCIIASLPTFCLAWFHFSLRRDELCIYQNGFTYKSRGEIQTCLWQDIESLTLASGKSHTYPVSVAAAVEVDNGELAAVTKRSGEIIEVNEELRCRVEVIDAIKAFRKAKHSGKRNANREINGDTQA